MTQPALPRGPARSGLFLYAKDLPKLSAFYGSLLGLAPVHEREERVVLRGDGLELVLHAIPPAIAATIEIAAPPAPREDTALKFFFTVDSLDEARRRARELGGDVLAARWRGSGFVATNAVDPEGNVFQLREFPDRA